MNTTASIDDVMASQVYNPTRDPNVVRLYETMVNTGVSDELLEEYKKIVTSANKVNPYGGVLYNPRACEIDLAKQILDEIQYIVKDRYLEVVQEGTPTEDYSPPLAAIDLYEEWRQFYPQIENDLDDTGTALDDYRDHTDRTIANFPSYVSTVQGNIGNGTGSDGFQIPTVPGVGGSSSNPCMQFGDMFGSIMGLGQQIMDMIIAALQNLRSMVEGLIQGLLQQIMGAIQGLMAAVQQMMTQMLGEITAMAMALLNMARMGLAQLMAFIPSDPCLNSILGGMITSAGQNILGKIAGGIGGMMGNVMGGLF